jgi:biotin synthase
MLSRVVWPAWDLKKVLAALGENSKGFKRVCIQTVNYPKVIDDLCELVALVRSACDLPTSVSCQPLGLPDIRKLRDIGADRICVALDAGTPELFRLVKGGCYTWEDHIRTLERARTIFGDRVSTHLIVGLGESEEEMARTIQFLHDRGITVGLFAFTPIPGALLSSRPPPDVSSYRRIQLARFFIVNNISRVEMMGFREGRIIEFGVDRGVLNRAVASGEPFRTSGCPGCNRPFYNESPRGPIYNYPRKLTSKEIEKIKAELNMVV